MKRTTFGAIACAVGSLVLASSAVSQPPPGGKDGKGGPPRYELGQVFPPPLVDELKLTPEQEKELDAIKKELKAKLEKLLTADQKKTAENFRPRGPGGEKGGRGPGGGEKGGPPAGAKKPDETTAAPAAGVQWFATLESGKAEAARTGRPILLVSGTPHCAGVSGMW